MATTIQEIRKSKSAVVLKPKVIRPSADTAEHFLKSPKLSELSGEPPATDPVKTTPLFSQISHLMGMLNKRVGLRMERPDLGVAELRQEVDKLRLEQCQMFKII